MTSASLVTHAVGTRRAKSLMPTRHQRDPRVARCNQTHLAVVVVRLWCIDLTVGLAVDVDHISMISVVVVDVRAVVVSITQPVAYSCRHEQATVLVPARMKARVDITWTVLQNEYTRSRDCIVLTNSN